MAKFIAKNKAQYHAAVQALQKLIDLRMQEMAIKEVQRFYEFCMNVLALAVEKAPVEYGDLRGTAFLDINGATYASGAGPVPAQGMPIGDIHARVVFPIEYAIYQHEHWEYNHPRGGQAFYLTIAVDEAFKNYMSGG